MSEKNLCSFCRDGKPKQCLGEAAGCESNAAVKIADKLVVEVVSKHPIQGDGYLANPPKGRRKKPSMRIHFRRPKRKRLPPLPPKTQSTTDSGP